MSGDVKNELSHEEQTEKTLNLQEKVGIAKSDKYSENEKQL